MGRKLGGVPPFLWGELGPYLTQCRLDRGLPQYQVPLNPSSHWTTTDMDRKLKNGGCAFLGRAGYTSNNVTEAEAYLHAKFHLDPSNRLAIIHQSHRQTGQTRSDSIGRTVLQTVGQKLM